MFLFLSLAWACVAAAQCHDTEPHLQKRDWVDGDRHCSYRESVVFESLSREFDRLVGPEPKATALITGEAMSLSAHEGAVFLEHGAEGEAAASLLFTTKPYEHTDGRRLAAVKRLVVEGPTAGRLDTLFESGAVWNQISDAPRHRRDVVTVKVDARGRIYVGCGDGVHVLSRDGELLGKIKLPGKDPAANLAFGKGKHRSTLYVLDETSVTAVKLPGTRGARVGRERKFDVGRVRYKST